MIEAMLIGAITGWVIWAVYELLNDIFDLEGTRAFHNKHIDNMSGAPKKEKKHGGGRA